MTEPLTRRRLIHRSAKVGLAVGVAPGVLGLAARAQAAAGPEASEVHLAFGADPAREMTVSWTLPAGATRPRVRVGPADGALSQLVDAELVAAVDRDARSAAAGNHTSMVAHARLSGLLPGRDWVYELVADGMALRQGTFRTAPAARDAYTFTAFGDQGTGDVRDTFSAVQGGWIVDQLEGRDPLLHLHLGDLVYANLNAPGQRGPAWERFMANNARSAANRPWMPILGNHEIESGNGPLGYDQYLARYRLPGDSAGKWYAYTVGGVRFVAVDAEDWALQKGGDLFNRGYSKGAQLAWLERELSTARAGGDVDWVVLAIHHPLVSSANQNGADLGVRQAVLPLLARHDVDLVLSGHDHDYERSFLLGPPEAGSATLRPSVVDRSLETVDATRGYVHLVIGGGGTKLPVTTYDVEPASPGEQASVFVQEQEAQGSGREGVSWVARRDESVPYGFAEVRVEPGPTPGGSTRLRVTYFRLGDQTAGPAKPIPVDAFTLVRPRADAAAPAAPVAVTTHPMAIGLPGGRALLVRFYGARAGGVSLRLSTLAGTVSGVTVELRRGKTRLARSGALRLTRTPRAVLLRRADRRAFPAGRATLVVRVRGRVVARRSVRLHVR